MSSTYDLWQSIYDYAIENADTALMVFLDTAKPHYHRMTLPVGYGAIPYDSVRTALAARVLDDSAIRLGECLQPNFAALKYPSATTLFIPGGLFDIIYYHIRRLLSTVRTRAVKKGTIQMKPDVLDDPTQGEVPRHRIEDNQEYWTYRAAVQMKWTDYRTACITGQVPRIAVARELLQLAMLEYEKYCIGEAVSDADPTANLP